MGFEQGSLTSNVELITKLNAFAVGVGWILDKVTADELYLHSLGESGGESLYFSFKTENHPNVIGDALFEIIGNTGFNGGSAWNNQPGKSIVGGFDNISLACLKTTGASRYWFFGDKDIINIVLDIDGTNYQHIWFGVLERTFTYNGGQAYGCNFGYYDRFRIFNAADTRTYTNTLNRNPYGGKTLAAMSVYYETVWSPNVNTEDSPNPNCYATFNFPSTYGPGLVLNSYHDFFNSELTNIGVSTVNGYLPCEPIYYSTYTLPNRFLIGRCKGLWIAKITGITPSTELKYFGKFYMVFPFSKLNQDDVGILIRKIV